MYKAYFIDLDGTLYKGKERIPSAEAFVKKLQDKGIPFLFVTNNATKTPLEVSKNLSKNYDLEISPTLIYTSGLAAIDYMNRFHQQEKVMVIGEKAFKTQVQAAGFHLTDTEPQVVLQALDRDVSYETLMNASLAIQKGATFIATNIDSNLPSEKGLIPGSGALTAFLKESTQVQPIIIGKPNHIIMEGALNHLHTLGHAISKNEIAMIGDNYQTDILAGIHYDMDTIMVLTGFSTRESIAGKEEQPTHIVENLSEWGIEI